MRSAVDGLDSCAENSEACRARGRRRDPIAEPDSVQSRHTGYTASAFLSSNVSMWPGLSEVRDVKIISYHQGMHACMI